MSVLACGDLLEMVGKVGRAVVAVQLVEDAQTFASVCLQIEDTYLLTRSDAFAWVLGDLVGQANLTGAEKQKPPFECGPHTSGTGHAQLGMTVGEHVCRLASRAGFDLCELIKGEERVAMCQRHPL